MPDHVNGLPTHVLLVHAVVVLMPLCALLLVLATLRPTLRARLGVALPALAAVVLVLVPVTMHAGEALESELPAGDLVRRHAALGDRVLPWAVGLLVLSLVVWRRGGLAAPTSHGGADRETLVATSGVARPALLVQLVVVVLSVVVAVGAVVQVVRTRRVRRPGRLVRGRRQLLTVVPVPGPPGRARACPPHLQEIPMTYDLDRRTLIGAACVGCVSLVAACGSSDDSAATPSTTGSSSTTTGSGSSGGAATAEPLAQLADIPQGGAVSAKSPDGQPIILSRTGADTVVGLSARCTHAGCTVAPAGAELDCPCHGSKFAAKDGAVINGPARKPLPAYAVKVVGGAVVPA